MERTNCPIKAVTEFAFAFQTMAEKMEGLEAYSEESDARLRQNEFDFKLDYVDGKELSGVYPLRGLTVFC